MGHLCVFDQTTLKPVPVTVQTTPTKLKATGLFAQRPSPTCVEELEALEPLTDGVANEHTSDVRWLNGVTQMVGSAAFLLSPRTVAQSPDC